MPPPDQDQRRQIVEQLDKTMLVEAAAGTGKTTGMLDRMVALIAAGHCQVETLAAVTFTRKTAAELRARFQVRLERAARDASGVQKQRLGEAVSHLERCFIGTIHSFCARLLRERPIEAGVDLAFQSLEVPDDLALRAAAWQESVERWIGEDDPRLDQLLELDLQVDQLASAFIEFANYPDVQQWDAEEVELPDWESTVRPLEEYVEHMNRLIPTFPVDRGTDKMMSRYEQIARLTRNRDLTAPAQLMEVLGLFIPSMKPVQKCWPGEAKLAKAEQERWGSFVQEVVEPLKVKWYAKRYRLVIDLLTAAAETYGKRRQAAGALNFQDLLMKTASLLRDKPQVRRYFRKRFTHLLVDEFQDTDPIQAEVMMFLTASDPTEQNWTRCQPVAGSLFVVGDPKQSIYRFTRADILTYEKVKAQILQHDGIVVSLSWSGDCPGP